MSFKLSALQLSELNEYQPNRLISLARQQETLKTQVLPKIESILTLIKEGKAGEATNLEWIYCIHTKADWDRKHPDQSIETSKILWKTAQENYSLRRILLWRLSLYYSEYNKNLPLSFVESFSAFDNTEDGELKFLIQIVKAIKVKDSSYSIVKVAHEYNITLKELKFRLKDQIPDFVPEIYGFLDYVSPYFLSLPKINDNDIDWFIKNLTEMPAIIQANSVSHFLEYCNIQSISCHIALVDWLQDNYDWRKASKLWDNLSDTAKTALRKLIGAVSYSDFQKWVDKILNRLSLPDFERNRLNRRSEFWSNYSDRFERIRILVPQSSLQVLDQEDIQPSDVLIQDASDATEICIFDFGEYLVTEFFRGTGGETRIFIKNQMLEEYFFSSSQLSIKQIRCQGGSIHDHEFLWQVYCEKILREKYGIYPNSGIKRFQGARQGQNQYDPIKGLQEPSQQDQRKRRQKLERWREKFERIEREAKVYCSKSNFSI